MAIRSVWTRTRLTAPSTLLLSQSRRSLSSQSRQNLRLTSPLSSRHLRQPIHGSFRRAYADAAPAPKPKKRFRPLRWAYRLTLLTGVGLTGWLAYSIYTLGHPVEQVEPDLDKKTLVILGMLYAVKDDNCRGTAVLTQSLFQEPDGVPFPCSKNWIRRTIMSSSSRPVISSCSPPCCPLVPPV